MGFSDTWDDEGWYSRTVTFGEAVYAARCPECARFVKVDEKAMVGQHLGEQASELPQPNATCAKHGRVKTPFLHWVGEYDEDQQ